MSQLTPAAPTAAATPAAARAESCSGCSYYDGVGKYNAVARGTCRRFPTAVGKQPSDWCGEFKAAPTKKGA